MSKIEVINVTKTYDNSKVNAVDNLSFTCEDKEFVAILGPSGAGKTTTLKMIAGIEPVTNGKIYIDDLDYSNVPPQKRNLSMVFENYALYPHLSVFDNLASPLLAPGRSSKFDKGEIRELVVEWSNKVGIESLLDRKPNQLSGGQRQRVSLARALIRSSELNVILMDEPLAHLDAKLRNNMRTELKRLHKDLGATIIYVTHDYVEAMAMADKIIVIRDGALQQQGTPKEIFSNPSNEFIASTVGEPPINFLRGELINEKDEFVFQFMNQTLSVKNPPNRLTEKIDIGLRPAEIEISTIMPTKNSLVGVIKVILPTGAKQIIDVDVSGETILVKTPRETSFKMGDRVYLTVRNNYFFSNSSKERLYPNDEV